MRKTDTDNKSYRYDKYDTVKVSEASDFTVPWG